MADGPTMDAGKASLVQLIHRYLGGLMDPFVTLLEIQKLMYFMQEAGEALRLKYAKGPYGPYAENLMKDDTELFKYFNNNPEFKRLLAHTFFSATYDRPTPTVPGVFELVAERS